MTKTPSHADVERLARTLAAALNGLKNGKALRRPGVLTTPEVRPLVEVCRALAPDQQLSDHQCVVEALRTHIAAIGGADEELLNGCFGLGPYALTNVPSSEGIGIRDSLRTRISEVARRLPTKERALSGQIPTLLSSLARKLAEAFARARPDGPADLIRRLPPDALAPPTTQSAQRLKAEHAYAHIYEPLTRPAPPSQLHLDTGFELVTRERLEALAREGPIPYVARPPRWSDVVHGANSITKFIERDVTAALVELVRKALQAATLDHSQQISVISVTGDPGSGKSTLVRRCAALLACDDSCLIADFGVNRRTRLKDTTTLAQRIRELAHPSPLLVVLDDPWGDLSDWPDFLERLAEPPMPKLVVLAASPLRLYERYARRLAERLSPREFTVGDLSEGELAALAAHYTDSEPESVVDRLTQADKDNLLLAAASLAGGTSLTESARSWWVTLAGGHLGDPRRPSPLVVAMLGLCCINRYRVVCDAELLGNILRAAGLDADSAHVGLTELRELALLTLWGVQSTPQNMDNFVMGHTQLAETLWASQPVPGDQVQQWVAKALAEYERPQTVAEILNAATLHRDNRVCADYFRIVRTRLQTERGSQLGRTLSLLPSPEHMFRFPGTRKRLQDLLEELIHRRDEWSGAAAWYLFAASDGKTPTRDALAETMAFANLSFDVADPISGTDQRLLTKRILTILREQGRKALHPNMLLWCLEHQPRNAPEQDNAEWWSLILPWVLERPGTVFTLLAGLESGDPPPPSVWARLRRELRRSEADYDAFTRCLWVNAVCTHKPEGYGELLVEALNILARSSDTDLKTIALCLSTAMSAGVADRIQLLLTAAQLLERNLASVDYRQFWDAMAQMYITVAEQSDPTHGAKHALLNINAKLLDNSPSDRDPALDRLLADLERV